MGHIPDILKRRVLICCRERTMIGCGLGCLENEMRILNFEFLRVLPLDGFDSMCSSVF